MTATISHLLIAFGYTAYYTSGRTSSTRWKRLAFSVVFLIAYLYGTIFFVINSMTGNGVDDSVLYHMKHGIEGAGIRQFVF